MAIKKYGHGIQGWTNYDSDQSKRHSLASQGISTGRKSRYGLDVSTQNISYAKNIPTIIAEDGRKYKILDGTYYHGDTSDDMVVLLERLRESKGRYRFHWGDTKTGKDWGDIHDVVGRIGRSTGGIKVPLLIYNNRSLGGGAILTGSIVKITSVGNNPHVIYQHPKYHVGKFSEQKKVTDYAKHGFLKEYGRYPQTGKTHVKQDRKLSAMPAGWRMSDSGNKYFEDRRNRSDNQRTRI